MARSSISRWRSTTRRSWPRSRWRSRTWTARRRKARRDTWPGWSSSACPRRRRTASVGCWTRRGDAASVRMRPLSEVSTRELRPLLEEESDHWAGELLWDYRDVSSAVASGVERRALTGFVLQDGLRAMAYCYSMIDGGRAIVGSVFAAAGFRGQGLEEKLVEAVIRDAQRHPHNERVECQTLFSTAPAADQRF